LTNPLVSVVTPSYNHAPYLPDFFEGLLAQTYQNIELVLIDDCSPDHSWQIILDYKPKLEAVLARVIVERNQQNEGFFSTLRRMQGWITGTLYSILESDDYYYPSKVEENVRFLQMHPDYGAVHSDTDHFFVGENRLHERYWHSRGRPIAQGQIFHDLLQDNYIMTCSFCCHTDLIKKFVDVSAHESAGYKMADYPMFLDLARHTQIGYIDKALACYRVLEHSASHSSDSLKQLDFQRSYYQIKMDYLQRYDVPAQVQDRVEKQWHRNLFRIGYEAGKTTEFWHGYGWLVEHYPQEYNAPGYRIRAFAMRNRYLWRLARWLEQKQILSRLRLSRLRSIWPLKRL
jgi:glycosyltransferase involved in cell wall biosynthesis